MENNNSSSSSGERSRPSVVPDPKNMPSQQGQSPPGQPDQAPPSDPNQARRSSPRSGQGLFGSGQGLFVSGQGLFGSDQAPPSDPNQARRSSPRSGQGLFGPGQGIFGSQGDSSLRSGQVFRQPTADSDNFMNQFAQFCRTQGVAADSGLRQDSHQRSNHGAERTSCIINVDKQDDRHVIHLSHAGLEKKDIQLLWHATTCELELVGFARIGLGHGVAIDARDITARMLEGSMVVNLPWAVSVLKLHVE